MVIKKLAQISLILISSFLILRQLSSLSQLISGFPLNDFSVYMGGVSHTLTDNPYTQKFFDFYNYSPAATLFFYPFSLLPINSAEFLFTGLSLLSLLISLILLIKLTHFKLPPYLLFAISYLLLRFFPTRLTLALGQINLIVLLLIILAFYWFTSKRQVASGVSLALAFIFKFNPAILLLFFLLKKQWRVIFSFFGTIVTLHLLAILAFGWPLTAYYYTKVLPSLLSQTGFATMQRTYMNQSLTALLGRLGIYDTQHLILKLVIILPLLYLISRRIIKSTKLSELLNFNLLVVFMTIFLPTFSWQHHYVFLIPAIFLLSLKNPPLGAISYLLLNFTISAAFPGYPNPFIHSHLFLSAIAIFTLSLIKSS